ncbi:hypothetical protein L4C36_17485 [Photobacterium japonica]|uniref:hypothetical protein n=1 Tax=Photobacterium japonica TaxID=2910235 RepID=UPI003D100DD5
MAQGAGFYSKEFGDNPGSMALLWVNMGNGQCNWDSDIVTHEAAHAMGMFNHLDGYFGSWSTTAMDVLATLYGNPAGTPYSSLVPQR